MAKLMLDTVARWMLALGVFVIAAQLAWSQPKDKYVVLDGEFGGGVTRILIALDSCKRREDVAVVGLIYNCEYKK